MNELQQDRVEQTLTRTLHEVAGQTSVDAQAPLARLRADTAVTSGRELGDTEKPPWRGGRAVALAAAGVLVAGVMAVVVFGLGRPSGDQQIEVGPAEAETAETTLRVLSDRPPMGFSLDFARALAPVIESPDCVGCVDLWIVPANWIPVGPNDFLAISVEPPGFTNRPEAEQLTIRGTEATLGSLEGVAKLAWVESDGVSVVMTFQGYSRDDAIAVAEALVIDGLDAQVQTGVLPDGSKAAAELVGGPATLMQYSTTDGQQLTIQAFGTDQIPSEGVRTQLSENSPGADVVVRSGGIGSPDPARPNQSFIWWNNDGLVFRMNRTSTDLDDEQLADFAETLGQVSETRWAELGGS